MSCQKTVGGGGVVIGQMVRAHPASVNPGNTQSGKVITMDNGYCLSRILGVADARSQSWPEVSSIQDALYRLQTDWRKGRCRYSARGGMSLILFKLLFKVI